MQPERIVTVRPCFREALQRAQQHLKLHLCRMSDQLCMAAASSWRLRRCSAQDNMLALEHQPISPACVKLLCRKRTA